MKNKIVLVTGGNGDIGKEIVKKLADLDAIICLQYFGNYKLALQIKKKIKNVFLFEQDFLGKEISIVQDVLKKFGRIDCLINCAGIIGEQSVFEMTSDDFDKIFAINTKIPYLISSQIFEIMKKNGYGRIINISSIAVKYGMGRNSAIQYAGSKAALESLTIGLSKLGAPHNILVNTIRPGAMNTQMQKSRPDLEKRTNMIPVKRMGEPSEIAEMVAFLLSEKGSFITGETITVGGGE